MKRIITLMFLILLIMSFGCKSEPNQGIIDFSEKTGIDMAASLRCLMSFGDNKAQKLLDKLLDNKATIKYVEGVDYRCKVYEDDNNIQIIEIRGFKGKDENYRYAFTISVLLQDCAYREGKDLEVENIKAVKAHTKMAMDVEKQFGDLKDNNIDKDIEAYKDGDELFKKYIEKNYDNEDRYWKYLGL